MIMAEKNNVYYPTYFAFDLFINNSVKPKKCPNMIEMRI